MSPTDGEHKFVQWPGVGQNPDETEEFELVHLGAAEIDEKIRNGRIWDVMSIAAWCVARLKLGG